MRWYRVFRKSEGLLIEGDFNGHIGSRGEGYETAHGGLGYGVRNSGGVYFGFCSGL